MAGIKMDTLAGNLKTVVESPRIIRVHNNTPAMVGAGCSVFSTGEGKRVLGFHNDCTVHRISNPSKIGPFLKNFPRPGPISREYGNKEIHFRIYK